MEGSSSILNPNRPCDICGDVGWLGGLMTCFICQLSREHIYCMQKNLPGPPEKWSCEACSRSEIMNSVQLPSKMTENLQIKLGSPPKSAARSSRSSRDYLKVVATGKVKYLAADDVVNLSSGGAAAMASMSSHAGSSRNMNHITSRKDSASVSGASKRFSKSPLPSQHTSHSGHFSFSLPRGGRPIKHPQVINTSLQSHAGKDRVRNSYAEAHRSPSSRSRPVECVAKEKHKVTELLRKDKPVTKVVKSPVNEHVLREEESFHVSSPPANQVGSSKHVKSPVKEFVLPEEESVHISSPLAKQAGRSKHGSSSKECEKLNFSENGLPDHLSINATWKGSFQIMGTSLMDGSYEGLQAYPSRKVHVKASRVFNKMPGQLQFKLHPRSDVLLENFNRFCPTKDDIALYFLHGDDESSTKKKNYHILSDFILERDMTMRSCLNDVELLIFSSKKLPEDCQKIKSRFYLCGVFRSAKKHHPSPKPSERSQHKDKNCSLCNYYDSDDDRLKHHPSSKPSESSQHKDKNSWLRKNYDSDADQLKHDPSPKSSETSQHKDKNCSLRNNYGSDADQLKHHPSPKPSESSHHKDKNGSLCNNYDYVADQLKHHHSPKPSEKSQHKDTNCSLHNNYGSDADQLKHHPSPKPSERSQHKDMNCFWRNNYDSDADRMKHHPSPKPSENSQHKNKNSSLCNNYNADTDRLKHHPSPKPSENSQHKNKNSSLCNNYNAGTDRLMHHPSPKPSERSQYKDKSYSVCNNYDTDVDHLNVICGDDSMGIDMDIDMVGGKDVGRIDKVIPKSNCGEKKIQFDIKSTKKLGSNTNAFKCHKSSVESAQQPLSTIKTEQPELDAPPGFPRPTTVDAAILEAPPGFSKPVNDLSSSKRKRSCLNDASTSEYFQVSTLQRQKYIQVSDSSKFTLQNHQVANHFPQTQSTSVDHKPAAEKEKSSECTRDGVHRINRISNEDPDPPKEDDCSAILKPTLRYDGVGGWRAH